MTEFTFTKFIEPYKELLLQSKTGRLEYYEHVINKLVNLNRPILVVETGTMHTPLTSENQGAFTLIFSDLIKNYTGGKLFTIDISEEHMNNCKINTSGFSEVIEYIVSDSVSFLSSMPTDVVAKIDLLYLDSWDLNMLDPLPSQIHHLRELSAVYHNLSDTVSIAVDDNLMPNCWQEWLFIDGNGNLTGQKTKIESGIDILGKGTLVNRFLLDSGWNRLPTVFNYTLLGYEKS